MRRWKLTGGSNPISEDTLLSQIEFPRVCRSRKKLLLGKVSALRVAVYTIDLKCLI